MLHDFIRKMIASDPTLAEALFEKSRNRNFRIPDYLYRKLEEQGCIFRGDVRANILDFFSNKVERVNGGTISMSS